MPEYRRRYVPGGTFFFTLVTCDRRPFLCDQVARPILRDCLREAQRERAFTIDAVVLLPDHLHAIWTLPPGDATYSLRWAAIKANFTREWLACGGQESTITGDHHRQGRRGVWQPRFYEHTVEDDDDFIAHVEYIHFNPVKHGLVHCPRDWPYSSFHRYIRLGHYAPQWCCGGGHETIRDLPDAEWLE